MLLWMPLLTVVCATMLPTSLPFLRDKSALCNPRALPVLYSGFRVYQVSAISFPVRHFWYVIQCSDGKVVNHQYFPSERNANFMFAKEFCLAQDKCFFISRRKKYANRGVPIFRPFSQVGALYRARGSSAPEPLLPVYADNTANLFTLGPTFGTKMRYMPILYTSDDFVGPDWERRVQVRADERYCYTPADKRKLWYKMNRFLTIGLRKLSLKKKLVFWEFDATRLQLMGIDWRRPVNKWLLGRNWTQASNHAKGLKNGSCPAPETAILATMVPLYPNVTLDTSGVGQFAYKIAPAGCAANDTSVSGLSGVIPAVNITVEMVLPVSDDGRGLDADWLYIDTDDEEYGDEADAERDDEGDCLPAELDDCNSLDDPVESEDAWEDLNSDDEDGVDLDDSASSQELARLYNGTSSIPCLRLNIDYE